MGPLYGIVVLLFLALSGAALGAEQGLTRPPRPIRAVEPAYPPGATGEATVVLEIDVDETGKVTRVDVDQSGGAGFDESATRAASAFVFEPAQAGGQPVPVRITYTYRFSPPKRAPHAAFRGKVVEMGTRAPVGGATVGIPDLDLQALTAPDGRFQFPEVPSGTFKVAVGEVDHYPLRATEVFTAGEELEVVYRVRRLSYAGYETVVRARREEEEVTRRPISMEEARSMPGTFGDALRVVQDMPGVARSGYGGAGLVIRGSAPQDSITFLDGHEIPLLYHFGGLTSTYNPDFLENIDFLPGGFSVRYGRAMGGIVDVETRDAKTDRLHGAASVDPLMSNVEAEGPVGSGSAYGGFRRSYIDAVLSAAESHLPDTGASVSPKFYDFQLQGAWPVGSTRGLSAQVFGSGDSLVLTTKRPVGREAEATGNVEGDLTYQDVLLAWKGDPGFVEPSLSLGVSHNQIHFDIFSLLFLQWEFWLTSFRGEAPMHLLPNLKLTPGVDVEALQHRVTGLVPGLGGEGSQGQQTSSPLESHPFLVNGSMNDPAGFVELDWEALPGLRIIPGVRTDYFSEVHQTTADPRIAVRERVRPGTILKASVGLFHQPPDPSQTTPGLGNPDLKAQQAIHYVAGVEQDFEDAVSVDVEGFYKDLSHLVAYSSAATVSGGQLVQQNLANAGSGMAYGAEILVRKQLTRNFFGWLAYTYSRSYRRSYPAQPLYVFNYDQPHILTAIASYRLPLDWEIGARFRYASGNLITPLTRGPYDADQDRYYGFPGTINSVRLPDFNQLDLRVDKRFIYTDWILDFYLDLENVYNEQNVEGVQYNYDYTQRTYVTGLPILPFLGVRADF